MIQSIFSNKLKLHVRNKFNKGKSFQSSARVDQYIRWVQMISTQVLLMLFLYSPFFSKPSIYIALKKFIPLVVFNLLNCCRNDDLFFLYVIIDWHVEYQGLPAIYRDDREVLVLPQILHLTQPSHHLRLLSQFPFISSWASIRHKAISCTCDVTKLWRSALIASWFERDRYHYRWCRERHTSDHGWSSSDRRTAAHTHQP